MNEVSPCMNCSKRYSGCHDSCTEYKEWRDRYRAQKQYLEDAKNRWRVPLSSAREKAYANYHPDRRKYSEGGSYE